MNQPAYQKKDPLEPVQEMVQACIQCGTCTSSCPNEFAMDITPRHMWRMVLMGRKKDIFQSKTFDLCSACYYCTLRCPRGLPLTEAMGRLKQIAARENLPKYKTSVRFYKSFMESVRRHGRVREMEFMTLYFASMKDPILPLKFTPLGIQLMSKRKVSIQIPSKGEGTLDAVFRKVEELEK
ncbi:4Fe-4S dicluster domain-containing protein [Desulfonema magnum]|uniref:4Fe-4S dicluster domain-containing protein n=2 Tax=Desulfonema magnum TaxID=45655 RepID=A0A975BZT9_9BACT|nr:4Fe-4S dicluster domain-containing protein [Desulfonema magnum]QTA93967.1 4Fe-4S dicluster domain-containing protein [Desulfonema magnum]